MKGSNVNMTWLRGGGVCVVHIQTSLKSLIIEKEGGDKFGCKGMCKPQL